MKGRGKAPANLKYAHKSAFYIGLNFWHHLAIQHAWLMLLRYRGSAAVNHQGPLQVSDDSTVHQQDAQADANQQEDSQTAAAKMPALQDDGWDEQTGWDFQDVPLDSPESVSKQTTTSHTGSSDRRAAHAARQGHDTHGQANGHDMQLASLQKANDTLTAKLKHVEAVRKPHLRLSHVHWVLYSA